MNILKRFFYNLQFVRRKKYDESEERYMGLALDVIYYERCVLDGKIYHHIKEDNDGIWVYGYCAMRDNDTPIKYIPYADDKGKSIRKAKRLCFLLNECVHNMNKKN